MKFRKPVKKIGNLGEEISEIPLRRLGVGMIEKIGTPVHLYKHPKLPNYFRVTFGEKVAGDRRGIMPGSGRSVLVETKTIRDHNLRWSDMSPHQPGALSKHAELGGISLLVWVHENGIFVLRWPIDGFAPGHGITPERASELNVESLEDDQ